MDRKSGTNYWGILNVPLNVTHSKLGPLLLSTRREAKGPNNRCLDAERKVGNAILTILRSGAMEII